MLSDTAHKLMEENSADYMAAFNAAGVNLSAEEMKLFQEAMKDFAYISVRIFAWFCGMPILQFESRSGLHDLAALPVDAFRILWVQFVHKHPGFMPLMDKVKKGLAESRNPPEEEALKQADLVELSAAAEA